jgi:uncharacterized damage-inducible protein DinB
VKVHTSSGVFRVSEIRRDRRNLKEFAIDTLEIAFCNLLKSIQGLKPEEVFKKITPEINTVGSIISHCAAHMNSIFIKKCQGKTLLPKQFKFSFKSQERISSFSFKELVDSFLTVADSAFAYLEKLPEERFRDLPEKVDPKAKHPETLLELIQRISLHFMGHMGQIRVIRKELGNPSKGFFVAGISKSSRENLLIEFKTWWEKSSPAFT